MTVRAFGYEPGKGNFPRPVFFALKGEPRDSRGGPWRLQPMK